MAPRARPTFFASPKKVGKERRPRGARPSAACGGGGGPLCFSKTGAAPNLRQLRRRFEHAGRTAPRFSAMLGALYGEVKQLSTTGKALNILVFKWARCVTNGAIVVCCFGALPLPRVVPAQAGTQARSHSVATVKTR